MRQDSILNFIGLMTTIVLLVFLDYGILRHFTLLIITYFGNHPACDALVGLASLIGGSLIITVGVSY